MGVLTDAEQLRRRNRDLSVLNDIARSLNESIDLTAALQTTLAKVAELLSLDTGWVWLINEEDESTSYLAAAQNLPPALANNPYRMEGTCYCLDTYRAGDMAGAANVNVVTCSRLKNLIDGTDGLRYHASIPLVAHGKKLGVLNVASTDWRELDHDDLQLLYTIGDLLSIAVERARLFSASMTLGVVKERNRLAREIHDTLAQGLTAVSLRLESADALLEAGMDREQVRQAVQQALSLTRANLEEARRSVMDLRAAPLEGRGLAEALQTLVDEIAERQKLKAYFKAVGATRPMPPRLETGLYRIAQEALANVIQHAQAEQVVVKLISTPHEYRLLVEDDGCGFDPDQTNPGRFGLVGLNERARLLGGVLHLETGREQGTRLEVVIPVEQVR